MASQSLRTRARAGGGGGNLVGSGKPACEGPASERAQVTFMQTELSRYAVVLCSRTGPSHVKNG